MMRSPCFFFELSDFSTFLRASSLEMALTLSIDTLFYVWAMNNEDIDTTSTLIPAVSVIIKQDRNQVLKNV